MNDQGGDWPSGHVPLVYIDDENVLSVQDDSQLRSASAGYWEDSNPTHAQQEQLQDYSRPSVPRESADYHVGFVQEDTVSNISEFRTACGTTEDGCNPLIPVSKSLWCQEEESPYQQSLPVYPHQQPYAGIGASSHNLNSNGFANVSISNPYMATNNEPWSSYHIFNGSRDTRHANQMQMMTEQHASDVTRSMFGCRDGSDSVYPDHNGLESTMSKTSSECFPFPFPPSAPFFQVDIPAFSDPTSFGSPSRAIHAPNPGPSSRYGRRNNAERAPSLKKTVEHRGSYRLHQGRHLAPPMQRRVSSASSQTTEATLSSAVSDHTPEILTCPEASCDSSFSGKYRKGNRKRHVKTRHHNQPRSVCKICSKTFARSDALLKHFRKQHS